jgi:leucyl aminopeptidase
MDLRGIETASLAWSGDCLAVGLFENAVELTGELATLDQQLAGTLAELIEETEFKGKEGSSAVARVGSGSTIRKIAVVGLGKADAVLDLPAVTAVLGQALQAAQLRAWLRRVPRN